MKKGRRPTGTGGYQNYKSSSKLEHGIFKNSNVRLNEITDTTVALAAACGSYRPENPQPARFSSDVSPWPWPWP